MSDQEAALVRGVRSLRKLVGHVFFADKYQMQAAFESCAGKTVMAGVMGFGLGGAFGLFMASMSYDSSMTAQSQAISNLPVREQIKQGFKDMRNRSYSSAKNFGRIGAYFSGTECVIEGVSHLGCLPLESLLRALC